MPSPRVFGLLALSLPSLALAGFAEKICADKLMANPEGMLNLGGMELNCETAATMLLAEFTASPETCETIPDLIASQGMDTTFAQLAALAAPVCCNGGRSACDPRIWKPPMETYGGKRSENVLCYPKDAGAPLGTTMNAAGQTVKCEDLPQMVEGAGEITAEWCGANMGADMPIARSMGLSVMEPVCCPYCTHVCNPLVLEGAHPGCNDDGSMKEPAKPTPEPTPEPTPAPTPAPTSAPKSGPAPAPAPAKMMTHTGSVELSVPAKMADDLVTKPSAAKKIMETALKKSMGLDTVEVTAIKLDGEPIDLSRRLGSHTTVKKVEVHWTVKGKLTKEDVEGWADKAKDTFPQAVIDAAPAEGVTLAKVEMTSAKVLTSVAAPAPAPDVGEETSGAWRQAIPSVVGLAALLQATLILTTH